MAYDRVGKASGLTKKVKAVKKWQDYGGESQEEPEKEIFADSLTIWTEGRATVGKTCSAAGTF